MTKYRTRDLQPFVFSAIVFFVLPGCWHVTERDSRSPFSSETGTAASDDAFEKWKASGDTAFKQQQYQRALECYQQADQKKASAPLKVQIGDCLRELGRLENAMGIYQKALALNAKVLGARVGLAQYYKEEENYCKALELLNGADALQPGRPEVINLQEEVNQLLIQRNLACDETD